MKVGSLFSGIGGIDLGLERAGMEVRWQCEIDPYCRKVLAKHWPDIPCYDDVRNLPDDIEPVDLICGGYPCQPFSLAGARRGDDDPRHLWPAFASALRLLRPEWALLENVPGHLSLGFGDVLGDLAKIGYDTEWTCIPAAGVGAPHLRWRLFVVAHAHSEGQPGEPVDAFPRSWVLVPDPQRHGVRDQPVSEPWGSGTAFPEHYGSAGMVADSDGIGWGNGPGIVGGMGSEGLFEAMADATGEGLKDVQGGAEVTEQPGRGAADGTGWWDVEPDVGRVAHGVPSRVDRLRALGNAVVPQVAEFVGRRIMAAAA